jgi:hypothetical protein
MRISIRFRRPTNRISDAEASGRAGTDILNEPELKHLLGFEVLDDWVEPILKKMVGCVDCRMQCLRLRVMDSHGGVVSIGALTPNRLG